MARKRFDAHRKERLDEEVVIVLAGDKRVQEPGEDAKWVPHEEEFQCVPVAPAGIMTTFVRSSAPVEFVEGCILEDADAARFRRLVFSKDFVIEMDALVEVVNWLVEEYSSRPTKRPTSSSPGPSESGNGSEDG